MAAPSLCLPQLQGTGIFVDFHTSPRILRPPGGVGMRAPPLTDQILATLRDRTQCQRHFEPGEVGKC